MLGYTPISWDDSSGTELQPWSSIKSWTDLTNDEKAAGRVLGYTATTWDNDDQPQPASADKEWSELRSCENGEISLRHGVPCL